MPDNEPRTPREPLLTARAVLVFLISILAAMGAGFLAIEAGRGLAEAVLVGAVAFAATAKFTDWLIS